MNPPEPKWENEMKIAKYGLAPTFVEPPRVGIELAGLPEEAMSQALRTSRKIWFDPNTTCDSSQANLQR